MTWILLGYAGGLVLLFTLMRAGARADRASERLLERHRRALPDGSRPRAQSPPRLERARGGEPGWSHAAVPGRLSPRWRH